MALREGLRACVRCQAVVQIVVIPLCSFGRTVEGLKSTLKLVGKDMVARYQKIEVSNTRELVASVQDLGH